MKQLSIFKKGKDGMSYLPAIVVVIAVLAVVGVGVYFALESGSKAEFEVTSLALSPAEAKVGQTVTVSAAVKNTGDSAGAHKVVLTIDGEEVEAKEVTLAVGETKTITFTIMKDTEGTFTVGAGGLTKSLEVRALIPAEFEISNLSFNPSEAEVGNPVVISATVKNVGDLEGTYTVELKIDGKIQETKDVTLADGETETVSFTVAKNEAKTYNVTVDGFSGSFLVKPEPWKNAWLRIFLSVPREVDQANYFQTVENLIVTYNIPPSGITNVTDEYGNNYKVVYWDEEQTGASEIIASMETIISRKMVMTPVTTSDPYPISENLLPNDVKLYLESSYDIQSDDPAIVSLAQNLSQGFTKEVDVVNNTLDWISHNIEWSCPIEIENYSADAVWTLEHKEGNCANFANLMIALFRAEEIPAHYVFEFLGYEHDNPGYLTPVETSGGHACVEVYYPEVGWVRYGPSYLPPVHMPYGIPIYVMPDVASGYGVANADFTEKWQAVGSGTLENNTVKLTYTVICHKE